MKKLLCVLLALVLPFGLATVSLAEAIPIEIMTFYLQDMPDDDIILNHLEEKFGIDLKITTTIFSESTTAINLRVASGDYADAFFLMDQNTYDALYQDDLIINISEYIDKLNLTNLNNHYELNEFMDTYVKPEGRYAIPAYIGHYGHAMYIRGDWLDQLGLEMPSNFDEFRVVLEAFKENDPDGAGCYPMSTMGNWWIGHFLSYFSGFNTWAKIDGVWTYEKTTDGFREGLSYVAGLYADGLLDPEFLALDQNAVIERFATGRTGMFFMNGDDTWYDKVETLLHNANPNGRIDYIMPWMEGPGGAHMMSGIVPRIGTVIMKDIPEEKKEKILTLYDYLCSPEGEELLVYGLEGIHYTLDGDGNKVINYETTSQAWGQEIWKLGEDLNWPINYVRSKLPKFIENMEIHETNAVVDPVVNLPAEKTQDVVPVVNDVYNQWVSDFMCCAKDVNDDAVWAQYLSEMQAAGLDEYIQIVTEHMEGK